MDDGLKTTAIMGQLFNLKERQSTLSQQIIFCNWLSYCEYLYNFATFSCIFCPESTNLTVSPIERLSLSWRWLALFLLILPVWWTPVLFFFFGFLFILLCSSFLHPSYQLVLVVLHNLKKNVKSLSCSSII